MSEKEEKENTEKKKRSFSFSYCFAVVVLGVLIFTGVQYVLGEGEDRGGMRVEGDVRVEGNVSVDETLFIYRCDSDLWFCEKEKIEICASQFPGEDYIVVAKTDYNPGSTHQWKTSETFCVGPQCVDLGISYTGMVLTNEHDVDFSLYPARNACKSYGEGARLPTEGELSCIYTNRSSFGTFASALYWSATEHSEVFARRIRFSDGNASTDRKTLSQRVRCVLGH